MLYSGEKSVDLDRSIKTKKFLDGSSIPLLGHIFHSKLYLFEHARGSLSELNLIVGSFNVTPPGLSQNMEFWGETKAQIDLSVFGVENLTELVLDPHIDINAISWNDFCSEERGQLVVAPALEVLWRLTRNGTGLAPGKPICISDITISENHYEDYDSIFVHTLGNNSLTKAIEIMIREATEKGDRVIIRVVSPYHNMQGLRYLRDTCIRIIGRRNLSVKIEVLTVFPPDFPDKFGDPKKQPFATMKEVNNLSSACEVGV